MQLRLLLSVSTLLSGAFVASCALPHSEGDVAEDADLVVSGDSGEGTQEEAGKGGTDPDAGMTKMPTDSGAHVPDDGVEVPDTGTSGPAGGEGEGGMAGPPCDGQTRDCVGTCGGSAVVDDCNVCNGKNASKDCAGTCGGSARADCNGVCNGPTPPKTYYRDLDGDTLGDPHAAADQCAVAAGYVSNRDDCDDTRKGVCTPTDILRFKRKIVGSPALPWNQTAIAGLGDVDGDKVPDLVIADRIVFLNANGSVKGSRRIVAGDLGVTDLRASFGAGVAALRDVDGNGVPDVAISEAPTWTSPYTGATDIARIWVLLLNRAGAPLARALVLQPSTTAPSGCLNSGTSTPFIITWTGAVAASDVDGDGKLELVASTSEDCDGPHVTGRLELFKLSQTGTVTPLNHVGYTQAPYTDSEFMGAMLASAGDANADGAGDLALMTSNGKLWTLLLSRAGALIGSARLNDSDTADASLASMNRLWGPLPATKASDAARVLVNLPGLTTRGGFMAARPASTQGQKVYRLFYPKELNVETQVAAGDGFGQAGTCLGDLENDGLPEVIATAPSDDSGGADLGAAYVLGFVGDCSNQTLRGDCNATASDGCETTLTSMDSCGACGRSCSGAPNSTGGSCSAAGNCDLSCVDHFGDCNGDVRDGCETDLRTSVDHCGACATKCAVRNHALPVCNAGTCGVGTTCQTPWSDCNANPSDGCEACGSCNQENTTSAPAGAIPPAAPCLPSQVCQQQFYYPPGPNYPYGRCVTVCALGRGDCNGIASDGCEANLTLQTQCGACGPNTGCGVWSFLDYCVLNDTATGYECR